ncbi:phosphoribosylanthranilate isomerase [Leptolyngbya sp. FACHB-261]|uniref:phosphoribosylanthranilate isomerase n=1 Tax=Leptolyngbya sp. FACHB-261 TaxID=2692806 RepID=UPI001686CCAF|nr:phosphoribosylanthranilate isomerase [Leptolyngbya sp. FACHB-261]MBD2103339.1 phosphoribosylanthranilate isomerase [Leptolyngbya sp. FACHB-261]
MRVKICGITRPEQGVAIARCGANSLGFICVSSSPRAVTPAQIRTVTDQLWSQLPAAEVPDRLGVFADASLSQIQDTVLAGGLNGVQLHSQEPPEFCAALRAAFRKLNQDVDIVKALRIRTAADLAQAALYADQVDALLLDAYDPVQLGGTGHTLDWTALRDFRPGCAWILAGGLNASNISRALMLLDPDGIDLSSGVERAPGDKDLAQVAQFFEVLANLKKPQIVPS